jgi:hypothetical protein
MDSNEKIPNDKVAKLENEIKVLKNEVQAVLLDLRESYLNMENPFNSAANPATIQPIVINGQAPTREPTTDQTRKAGHKSESSKPGIEAPSANLKPIETESKNQTAGENSPDERYDAKIACDDKNKSPNTGQESPTAQCSGQSDQKNSKLDLVTMAGLAGWVEQSTNKIGRERTVAVLEMSELMGRVSSDLKPVLIKLITLAPVSALEHSGRTRDYVHSLAKINSLLGSDNREATALLLLSLESGEINHG